MIDIHIVGRAGQDQRRNGVVGSELPDGLFNEGMSSDSFITDLYPYNKEKSA
jgi:hypothetical protein